MPPGTETVGGDWILACAIDKGLDAAADAGEAVLSQLAEGVLAAAIDAYLPGAASLLGLGGDDGSQRIIDHVSAEHEETRALIKAYWDWARRQQDAAITVDFETAVDGMARWETLSMEMKAADGTAGISSLIKDMGAVMTAMELHPEPGVERRRWIHPYAVLAQMRLDAIADHVRIVSMLAHGYRVGQNVEAWHRTLSSDEGAAFEGDLRTALFEQYRLVLHGTSLPGPLHGELGGVIGFFEEVTERTDEFIPVFTSLAQSTGRVEYYYYVEPSEDETWKAHCASDGNIQRDTDCRRFRIYASPFSSSGACQGPYLTTSGFQASFDEGAYTYCSVEEAYEAHRRLATRAGLAQGYGPVRLLLDTWWGLVSETGYRPRWGLDRELDAVAFEDYDWAARELNAITEHSREGSDAFSASDRALLVNMLLAGGVEEVRRVLRRARQEGDYMDVSRKHSSEAHLEVAVDSMLGADGTWRYRAYPAAKLMAVLN